MPFSERHELMKSGILVNVKNIFMDMKEKQDQLYIDSTVDTEAYRKTRDIEQKSIYFYLEKAEEAEDVGVKNLLMQLARMEEKHRNIMQNPVDFSLVQNRAIGLRMRNGTIRRNIKTENRTMNTEFLTDALSLADGLGYILVATADSRGIPHLAVAERITLEGENRVSITEWFPPRTTENVDENPNITLVIWDRKQDTGFQLIGEVLQPQDIAIMNGYLPEMTEQVSQIERKMVIRNDHMQKFSHVHHTDTNLI
jgi:uncharacterized protein